MGKVVMLSGNHSFVVSQSLTSPFSPFPFSPYPYSPFPLSPLLFASVTVSKLLFTLDSD